MLTIEKCKLDMKNSTFSFSSYQKYEVFSVFEVSIVSL